MTALIAIVGGSGSGKSTLAQALRARLPAGAAVVVSEDRYYRDEGGRPGFDPAAFDFDDLSARDHALLLAHLSALKGGEAVTTPDYCFVTHRRLASGEAVAAAPVVLVEGAHLLCSDELAALFDLSVFIDTPPDVRFIRRLMRDQVERGRTVDSIVGQYLATVRPAYERWVGPCRERADIVIHDDSGAVALPEPRVLDRLLVPLLEHALVQGAGA